MDIFDIFFEDEDEEIIDLIEYGIPRRIYERANHFDNLNDLDFFQRFRLSKQTVQGLLALIEDDLRFLHDINNCISPMNQLLMCLRVFATGGHLISVADFGGCHKSSVSRIVVRVTEAIARLSPRFIIFPTDDLEIADTQNSFFEIAGFPRVTGVIDCTHIKIQSPGGEDPEVFRNRKSYFSLNVQAICNSNYEFTNIVARWPGSTHDATIFNNSLIRAQFETNRFPQSILLGDSGYPCRTYLLTPLLNPVNDAQRLYNEAHIRTRVKIENTFGIWKRRFPILAYGSRLKLPTVMTVVVATAVLHNIARNNRENEPPIDPDIDQHQLQHLIEEGHIPAIPQVQNQRVEDGFHIRNEFVNNYFGRINR